MAKAFIKHGWPSVTDDIIVTWQEIISTGVLGAEIDRETYSAPHTERELTVVGLNPTMHQFQFWQSSDGTTLETLLLSLDIDASIYNENAVEVIQFVVGDGLDVGDGVHTNPADTDTEYRNDNLADALVYNYIVYKPGLAPWHNTLEITKVPGGGFDIISGDQFAIGETFTIVAFKSVAAQVGSSTPPVTSAAFGGVIDVTGDITYGSSHYNCLLNVTGASPVIVVDLDLSAIPTGKFLHLITHDFTGNTVQIDLASSQTIQFLGVSKSIINIGQGEEIKIYFDSGGGYVVHYEGGYRNLGQRRMGTVIEQNELLCDGAEYVLADYPRVAELLAKLLPFSQVLSNFVTWGTSQDVTIAGNTVTTYPNKGFWFSDGNNFRPPDDRNMTFRALKFFDGTSDAERLTQAAGGLQHQQIISHRHKVHQNDNAGEGSGSGTKHLETDNGTRYLKGENIVELTGGTETRGDNHGLYAYVKI